MEKERTIYTPFSYLCWPAVNARLQKKYSCHVSLDRSTALTLSHAVTTLTTLIFSRVVAKAILALIEKVSK